MLVRNNPRFRLAWLYVLILGCTLATAATAAKPSFEAGVTASQRGDYQQAVEHFNNARDEGLDTPALHHNLGVAYYKLGRYESAHRAFERAAESPKMRAMSFYNLGLVAQKEGDDASARDWFRKAHESARTRKLRGLAAKQLGLTERTVPSYKAYLEGFAGHDSNPRLAEEEPIDPSDESEEGDAVFGALAVGERLLGGDWDRGATVIGVGYADFHPDLDGHDIGAFAGGFRLHHSPGRWRHRYELMVNRIRLGGDTLQTGIRASLRSQRQLSRHLVAELRLRGEDIDGDDGFDGLDGTRFEARTRLIGRHGPRGWKLYYEFEHNDRDDFENEDGDFFSVSPVRHEIGGSVKRPLAGDFSGEAEVAFRRSEYRDPEVRDNGEKGEREDDRLKIGLGISHPLGRWTGRIETIYWDNSSDCGDGVCDRFEYDRLEARVSIGRSF